MHVRSPLRFMPFVWLALAFWLGACSVGQAAPAPAFQLTIAHTNDIEGALDPCSCQSDPAGGAARRAMALRQLRSANSSILLVDAGDALFGTPVANATSGQVEVAVMNALGYDAAALGDRDFNYGLDVLQQAIAAAHFPFLSANVVRTDTGQPLAQASTIVQRGSIRVALLGLTSPSVGALIAKDPAMKSQLKLLDPVATAKKLVPQLKQQADAVVVLSHLGVKRDEELARQVPGITAIVGGHDRKMKTPPEILGNQVPRAEMGYQGDYLGVLELSVSKDGRPVNAKANKVHLTSEIETDTSTIGLLTHYKALAALSGAILPAQALSLSFPLAVHRADAQVQKAYLLAAAYPQRLAGRPAPDGASGVGSLLGCFVGNPDAQDFRFDYLELATQTPPCVTQALDVLQGLSLPGQPEPVDSEYWPTE